MSVLNRIGVAILIAVLNAPQLIAETRVWTDSSGKHKIEAELLMVEGAIVTLRRDDGKVLTVPLDKLSQADQLFLRDQGRRERKTASLESVVRIVVPLSSGGGQDEILLVGCIAKEGADAEPVVLASRMAVPQDLPVGDVDAGLAKSAFLHLRSPKEIGGASRLGFPGPRGNTMEGMHSLVIVLHPAGQLQAPALSLAEKDPVEGDLVRVPLLPRAQSRSRTRTPPKIPWTEWTVRQSDEIRLYIEPKDGRFPSTGTLPVVNANNELVGLFVSKIVLADKGKLGDGPSLSVLREACAKAGASGPAGSPATAAIEMPDLPPIPTGPVNTEAAWRKSYEALVETISTKQGEDGEWTIDWGEAEDFGVWYERWGRFWPLMSEAFQDRERGRQLLPILERLKEEGELAAKRLNGVVWTAVTKRHNAKSKSIAFELPKLPKPLEMIFWIDEAEVPKWSNVKPGNRVRFSCRFEANGMSSYPTINTYVTLVEVVEP